MYTIFIFLIVCDNLYNELTLRLILECEKLLSYLGVA